MEAKSKEEAANNLACYTGFYIATLGSFILPIESGGLTINRKHTAASRNQTPPTKAKLSDGNEHRTKNESDPKNHIGSKTIQKILYKVRISKDPVEKSEFVEKLKAIQKKKESPHSAARKSRTRIKQGDQTRSGEKNGQIQR